MHPTRDRAEAGPGVEPAVEERELGGARLELGEAEGGAKARGGAHAPRPRGCALASISASAAQLSRCRPHRGTRSALWFGGNDPGSIHPCST